MNLDELKRLIGEATPVEAVEALLEMALIEAFAAEHAVTIWEGEEV